MERHGPRLTADRRQCPISNDQDGTERPRPPHWARDLRAGRLRVSIRHRVAGVEVSRIDPGGGVAMIYDMRIYDLRQQAMMMRAADFFGGAE